MAKNDLEPDASLAVHDALRHIIQQQKPRRRPISAKTRERVLKRDGHACFYCGWRESDGAKLEVEHIVAVALGGMDNDSNLVTACSRCNRSKRTESVAEWKRKKLNKQLNP